MKNKLFLSLSEYDYLMNKFSITSNASKINFINDAEFIDGPYHFSRELLQARLEVIFPSVASTGIMYIDIETPYLENLQNLESSNPEFQKSLNLFLDVLRFCKNTRPNVKFGYYSIPFVTYWERTPEFYAKNQKIADLLDDVDYLFPSMYTFYPETRPEIALENKKYILENSIEMVKLQTQFNKLVMPFITHRFHPSAGTMAFVQIQDDVFVRDIKLLLSTGLDNVIWWGADDYFFRAGEPAFIAEFIGTPAEYKIFNDKVLELKALKINKIL